jgi:hypothetical protein
MLLAQSEKSPAHDRFGRAFREGSAPPTRSGAAGAVHRNATIDGKGENPPLYSRRTR